MPNREPKLPQARVGADRIPALVVARESVLYDRLLMEGMIGQTVAQVLHLPGADEVLDAGITPMDGEGPFDTYQFRKHETAITLFEHRDVVYLYSTGSASKANMSETENQFVEFLCDVIDAYRPRALYAATFARMLRSLDHSGRLYQTLRSRATVIHVGGMSIDLSTPNGKAMWAMFSMMADMERAEIIKRLFAGLVFRYLQGRYLFGEQSLPPGYVLDGDGKVQIDLGARDGVRVLLEAMANPDLTARQVIDVAGEAGVTTPTVRRFHGVDATFADVCRADSRIASLVDWLPTYATGRTEIFHKNPYPGAKHFHGLEVEGASDTDPGFVRFVFQWDVPEGGWADPDVIAAAARRTTGRKARRTGGASHRRRKPLAGWVWWADAETEYRLSGTSSHYIVLRQRTKSQGRAS